VKPEAGANVTALSDIQLSVEYRKRLIPEHIKKLVGQFYSPGCEAFRSSVAGTYQDGLLGAFSRARCVDPKTSQAFKDGWGSQVIISTAYRLIYYPNMKVASSTFKVVMRRRFQGKIVPTHELMAYLTERKLDIADFFAFTFVREPRDAWYSAYAEIDERGDKRSGKLGFQKIARKHENEPVRATKCFDMVRKGEELRLDLLPKHGYSQFWKTQRCVRPEDGANWMTWTPRDPLTITARRFLGLDFIGKVENMDEDYRALETVLGVDHAPLPKTNPSKREYKEHSSWLKSQRFPELEGPLMEYLQADFRCFNYTRPNV
jgi:hypothetical protein